MATAADSVASKWLQPLTVDALLDVVSAAEILEDVIVKKAWEREEYRVRAPVT